MEFNDYLVHLKYQKVNEADITFVLGNQTADFDSILSALLLSYSRNLQNGNLSINEGKCKFEFKKNNKLYLPLINCPFKTFHHRFEVMHFFKSHGINYEDFYYYENVTDILSKKSTSLILVDHHQLDSSRIWLEEKVVEIYDHHSEDMKNNFVNLIRKEIYFCASCTEIILKNNYLNNKVLLNQFLKISNGVDKFEILFITLLLDSCHFKEDDFGVKWKSESKLLYEENIKYMFDIYGNEDLARNHYKELYLKLNKMRKDPDLLLQLNVDEIMEKDRKCIETTLANKELIHALNYKIMPNKIYRIQYSVMKISYDKFKKEKGVENILSYLKNQGCDIYVTVGKGFNGKILSLKFKKNLFANQLFIELFVDAIKEKTGNFTGIEIVKEIKKSDKTDVLITDEYSNYYEIVIHQDYSRKILTKVLTDIFQGK